MASKPLHEELRRMRHAAGLSQSELARRVDRVPSHVSLVERGERGVSIELVQAWASACGFDWAFYSERTMNWAWDFTARTASLLPEERGLLAHLAKLLPSMSPEQVAHVRRYVDFYVGEADSSDVTKSHAPVADENS